MGVAIFVFVRRFGGLDRGGGSPFPGKGLERGKAEHFLLLTFEKAHFGDGYLMYSDVLILELWFAVHRMLQGCAATNSVSFFSNRLQFTGSLAP